VDDEAKALVVAVRAAAERHNLTWDALIPDRFTVNAAAEAAEDAAYDEMAQAKRALRDHICATYGISIDELSSLAMP
jgi:hypothetical protein